MYSAYNTLQSYTSGIVTTTSNTIYSLAPVPPLPPAPHSAQTIWKFGLFPLFIRNPDPIKEAERVQALLIFFKYDNLRALLEPKHVLCALHNPGLALDLMVLYNVEHYQLYIKAHYHQQYFGINRDRLYDSLCSVIEQEESPQYSDPTEILTFETLETKNKFLFNLLTTDPYKVNTLTTVDPNKTTRAFVYETLRDKNKLLYQVLQDHRYSYSPQAFARSNPDTLSRLNTRLRERLPTTTNTKLNL